MATQDKKRSRGVTKELQQQRPKDQKPSGTAGKNPGNAEASGANDTGNKSQGPKFDSGNQTNR